MANYFLDNPDIRVPLQPAATSREVVALAEDGYAQSREYPHAPVNYEDAMENYRRVLEVVGDLAAQPHRRRAPPRWTTKARRSRTARSSTPKARAATFEELSQADLMGMVLPRKYGGLNFPFTIYMMAIEIISRADASLMNIFGLQDIGDYDQQVRRRGAAAGVPPEDSARASTPAPWRSPSRTPESDLQAVKTPRLPGRAAGSGSCAA